MKKQRHNVFSVVGLMLLACLLLVERFVAPIPDWASILIALTAFALLLIGFRKRSDHKSE